MLVSRKEGLSFLVLLFKQRKAERRREEKRREEKRRQEKRREEKRKPGFVSKKKHKLTTNN